MLSCCPNLKSCCEIERLWLDSKEGAVPAISVYAFSDKLILSYVSDKICVDERSLVGRPRKVNRFELIRQWTEDWEADLRPSKSEFARRFSCDRRTVVRILREAVDNYEIPIAAIGPRPFKTPSAEPKPQGLTFAW